jgi:hypothetical protein
MPVCSPVALQRAPLEQAEGSSHSHIEFHHEDRSPLGSPDAIFESRLYLDVDPTGIRATIDLVT